jgi:hypothetical protein
MCSYLESRYGISISKQALDERFNEKSISFVKSVWQEVLQKELGSVYHSKLFPSFHRVRIKDSTKFNVPATLVDYRGSGGSSGTSKAGICIQYEYDLKSGQILDMTLTAAVRNDQQDAGETVGNIRKSDLVLRDLGYFSTAVLASMAHNEAFFLSRLPCGIHVYCTRDKHVHPHLRHSCLSPLNL